MAMPSHTRKKFSEPYPTETTKAENNCLNDSASFSEQLIYEPAFADFFHEASIDEVFSLGAARFGHRQRIDDVLNAAGFGRRKVAKGFGQPFIKRSHVGVAATLSQDGASCVRLGFKSINSFDQRL